METIEFNLQNYISPAADFQGPEAAWGAMPKGGEGSVKESFIIFLNSEILLCL